MPHGMQHGPRKRVMVGGEPNFRDLSQKNDPLAALRGPTGGQGDYYAMSGMPRHVPDDEFLNQIEAPSLSPGAAVAPPPAETQSPELAQFSPERKGLPPPFAVSVGIGAENPTGEALGPPEPPPEFPTVTEDRKFDRHQLEGLRGIAEGLGNINLLAPGDFLLGTANRPQQPFIAEGIRSELAREEDFMTPQEIGLINQQYGLEIPEDSDLRRSHFRSAMPSLSAALSLAGKRELEEGRMKRFSESMEFKRTQEERRSAAEERRGWSTYKIPDVDRRAIQGTEFIIDGAKELRERFAKTADELGPIWGRWNVVARKLGMANAEAARTIADMSFLTSQFIYEMTGKQLNQTEMVRLEKVLPQAWDSPEQFYAIIEGFLNTTLRKRQSIIKGLGRQGYDVSPWTGEAEGPELDNDMTPSGDSSRSEASPGETQPFELGGKVFDIPVDKVEKFLSDPKNKGARRAAE